MKLIYGSQAIKYWFPDFEREPKDLDFISDIFCSDYFTTREIEYYYVPEFFQIFKNKDKKYLDKDYLYTFKVSHLTWDINWEKHMKDAQFLRNNGCKLDMDLYGVLYRKWEDWHGKKNVKMNVYNKDFFKPNIYRKYNHDELHEFFKFYERPLNEKIRYDLDSPLCSKELWDKLDYSLQLHCAFEEIFVLTAERYILVEKPLPFNTARVKTLKQMITSSTSGWFCRFLIENFDILRVQYQDYFKHKIKELR